MSDSKTCICISGVDGCGKSFITNHLIKSFSKKKKYVHVWSRFKNYFSKPLLLLTRITGHSYTRFSMGIKIRYHDFYKSNFISFTFLFFQWIDQFFEIIFRFKFTKNSIISDRSIFDTLVDLSIDTRKEKFIFGNYAKTLLFFMPRNTHYFVIDRKTILIKKKRKDALIDKNFNRRKKLYKSIVKKYPITFLYNNSEIRVIENAIKKKLINEFEILS